MSVSQHRRKDAPTARQRWSTLAFTALGLLLAQPAAYAAGFGQLRVQSNLGQPLQAEIDISGVSAEEADGLTVKLASPDAYAKAGLTYLPAVNTLRLQVERRPNGSYVARVRSTQPLSEPFVDILVDMTWSSGKVSRAYTFLLDPAGAKPSNQTFSPTTVVQAGTPDDAGAAGPAASAPAPSAAPVPAAAPAPVAASQAPRPQAKAPAPRPHRAAAPAAEGTAAAAGMYTVQRGDNLTAIANEASQGQDAVSLDQMLVALYRNNPNAFIGGNMNRLKAGVVLKVPSQQEAQAVAPHAARREVVARTHGFDAYRSRLATAAAARTVEAGSGREQSGNVTARVQEQAAPAAGPRDELKLSKPERGSQAAAAAAAESSIAKERQIKEAETRLAQLEKNVSDMQRLVELKNAELAKLAQTQKSAGKDGAAAPSAAPAVVPAGTAKADAGATAAPVTAEAGAGASAATAAAASTATAAPLAGSPASAASAMHGASGASASAADAAVAAAKPDAASTPAAKRPPVVTQPQPVAQPSFFEDLLANPMLLPGGGLLIALLGGYAIYRRRQQQKSSENAAFGDSILSQESTVMAGGNSLFGAAGGQSVDTSQHSVFGADFRIGNNTAEANEVDPIAEADVYIAYGRDVQAEEILREALQQNPERQAIRLKLMEIHNNRQDVEGFRVIAEEMFAQTGGQGAEWVQAAEMGRRLEPGNALYLSVAPDTASGDTTTLPGDQWRTHDPSQDPAAAPRETALADLADLALPLDGFPAPAAGAPITAPESASLVFGNADALPEALATRLDDGLDLDLDLPAPRGHGAHEDIPALDTPTRSRPLDFDMSGISLDLNPASRDDTVGDSHETRTFYGASSLPAPTMLRDGKLSEPIDLSRVSAESGLDTSRGISPSTLSADAVDGGRDMQIKFDLARAYIEIGDKEGARELLQEVVDQSQDPLLTEARSLLRDVA
ncbi:pilus assembly protein FimV [Burkholderiaceae bacterium 16]|nr:pilus assembly protein FimV [Burkholderiaceae bacterium 16]